MVNLSIFQILLSDLENVTTLPIVYLEAVCIRKQSHLREVYWCQNI